MFKLFVSLVLAFSIGVSAFHHHHDGRIHLDCPVCFFQLNNTAENPPVVYTPPLKIQLFTVKPVKKLQEVFTQVLLAYLSRAPPE
ncbi:hypothetical protein GWK41_09855 [Persephonella atlantica]|uniref:Uncharacterized protein n=1 Tax=Persephonella atlantica TaxID=2699429 RepID=A0ABS1GKE1_9AQUI|nr:hypothetical protein [Persephonella atlantica]MBK3333371.1 hypothetical protein [Persephonella atlantica]